MSDDTAEMLIAGGILIALFYTYIWTFGGWLFGHIQLGWLP